MNQRLHRIILNRPRVLLMVVVEIARTRSTATPLRGCTHTAAKHINHRSALSLSLGLVLALASPVWANIEADRTAPGNQQPTIISSANGTAQINIQTPSAAGVSRNSYRRFDISERGAILNNAHKATQTQLGGMVTGNPWLARGEARIILNEVNSTRPSQLNGVIEVAGKKAEVVIANPAGISCNGCGFINARRRRCMRSN